MSSEPTAAMLAVPEAFADALQGSDMANIYPDAAAISLWKAPYGPTDPSYVSAPSLATLMAQDNCITLDKSAAYSS